MKVASVQLRETVGKPELENATVRALPDCRTAFQRIIESCIEAIRTNQHKAISGNPDAIHDMRIGLTRLRAARLFFAPAVNPVAWRRIDRDIRWLNSVLGSARNCDVIVEYAERKRYRDWTANSRGALLRTRNKAHRRLARKLASARYDHLISSLNQWSLRQPSPRNSQAQEFDRVEFVGRRVVRMVALQRPQHRARDDQQSQRGPAGKDPSGKPRDVWALYAQTQGLRRLVR